MPNHVAVLDANVLYGIEVTDLLLTMAAQRIYRPHWSPQILDEVSRNLALRDDLDHEAIGRRISQMNRALPAALDQPPSSLVADMPVNDNDRHVLALAVHVEASVIVTENLRDFPHEHLEPFAVEAVSPDNFVRDRVEADRGAVLASIDAMAGRRRQHPKTRGEIIKVLARPLPAAMAELVA